MLALQRGFTLIEMIVGIVVLAISLSIITTVLGPLFIKSADPWHQVRAAELGQSLMNEIMAKAFDENSSRSGSLLRCGEAGAAPCSVVLGPEESERSEFDDVDDYHNFFASGNDIHSIFGASDTRLQDVYRGFQLHISVTADSLQTKRILLTVTTPTGAVVEFSAIRGNW
ncbi:type IV pilus modification PilV family protein [Rheinheimera maricola]|uniref:Type II secretion system GspH family protein n=1 Tax=Rheinheimera maricola TaxID=2793282 RepID=A0ABS7XGP9_9GAMM|nr:type II secretion system protein [Rheinheimera maricola]MBZ9613828.1 type II secretion system GspH family protein [Rheinheimera maricola]